MIGPQKESKGTIASAAGLMSVATLISRILGYVKDMILARYFGATGTSDVFFVAFRIPNLLRELFAEGAMSSAFIPVLTDCQVKEGREEANRLVRSVFVTLLIVLGIVCIVGIYFAPEIVTLIAPGFRSDHEKFELTVLLTRIMFPFLIMVSLSSLLMGALNTRGVFFVSALAPAFLNVVTIVTVVTLVHRLTHPITAVAIGVVLGGLVQFLVQMPSFYRQGYSLVLPLKDFTLFHSRLKRIGLLLLPATAGMAVSQINIFVSTIFASFLVEGSITALYYSMRLIQFPIGIFGVAMGMAALPALSRHVAEGRTESLVEDFSFSMRLLFFITIPAMAGLIVLREPIVNLLFQRGEFDYSATKATASALMYYSFGIWAIVGTRLCTTAFYALQNTSTPVKAASVGILTNIVMSYILLGPMGHNGLALANSVAALVNFGLLFYLLKRRLKDLRRRIILVSVIKTIVATLIMSIAAAQVIGPQEIWRLSGNEATRSIYLCVAILLALTVYVIVSYLLKSEEFLFLLKKGQSRLRKGG